MSTRKVKIVCTLGPACAEIESLREIVRAGMNVARFNFSHGDHAGHGRMLDMVRQIEHENDFPIATLLDTKGPEIRTGLLAGHAVVELKADRMFSLYTDGREGTVEGVSISYSALPKEVEVGQELYIDDGAMHLRIEKMEADEISCRVLVGGILGERKGVNFPGASLSVPTLTEKDIDDIKWGMDHDMDYIAVSFVRSRQDIMQVRSVVEGYGGKDKRINIMAKIETLQSVQNLEDIVQVVDAVMVARGDLGVEMPTEVVPIVQKKIIELCRKRGKPVIVATQMLDSMIRNPRPTRAEASDVANAVLDGADAVMLSGETANGKYPVEAVRTMENIVLSTERELLDRYLVKREANTALNTADSVSHAAMQVAEELKASAVISLTRSGSTASMVSKYRPKATIVGSTPLRSTWRALNLMWGVKPLLMEEYDGTETAVDAAITAVLKHGYVSEGDTVVITTGFPVYVSGTTNMLLVQTVGRRLFNAPSLVKREAAGFVCKVSSAAEAIDKMMNGNVLVAASTDSGYLPAMKKAAAFITEEAGMSNYTAMTALQLGIPCITGVEGAMEKLRDGMLVTVDGIQGVVYEGRMRMR
ncbi:MAG: pyruvate kinase [Synergistaceae bacterium]|jgi:pyruvate kinase|nr:pyruvate kinase [Synergistaceae bacterium]